jgi:hypothetical protein
MEESRAGKRRRDTAEATEAGRSALQAANDSLWACHHQQEQQREEQQAAPGEDGGGQTGEGAATAGTGALAEVAPALFEVLTRLLITDRSIRGSCAGQ